ncbi:unnamed protein product, partial [Brenthis ino]
MDSGDLFRFIPNNPEERSSKRSADANTLHIFIIYENTIKSRFRPRRPISMISQLRRRYYSARVYAQTQVSIHIALILRWDDHSTRPVRGKAQDRRLYVLSEARG